MCCCFHAPFFGIKGGVSFCCVANYNIIINRVIENGMGSDHQAL